MKLLKISMIISIYFNFEICVTSQSYPRKNCLFQTTKSRTVLNKLNKIFDVIDVFHNYLNLNISLNFNQFLLTSNNFRMLTTNNNIYITTEYYPTDSDNITINLLKYQSNIPYSTFGYELSVIDDFKMTGDNFVIQQNELENKLQSKWTNLQLMNNHKAIAIFQGCIMSEFDSSDIIDSQLVLLSTQRRNPLAKDNLCYPVACEYPSRFEMLAIIDLVSSENISFQSMYEEFKEYQKSLESDWCTSIYAYILYMIVIVSFIIVLRIILFCAMKYIVRE